MYRIKNAKYGSFVEDLIDAVFVKVQKGVDYPPILAESLKDADGVILSDDETMLGIEGRNMQNYEPLVTVEEISGEPQLFRRVEGLEKDLAATKEKLNALDQQTTALMLGLADVFASVESLKGGR